MTNIKKLEANSFYEIYVINPITTKFGKTYVLFDRVHDEHFFATNKIVKFIEEHKFDEIWENGKCLFKIKTRDYKSFKKDNKTVKFLDLEITK